jgi:hypothetical protein
MASVSSHEHFEKNLIFQWLFLDKLLSIRSQMTVVCTMIHHSNHLNIQSSIINHHEIAFSRILDGLRVDRYRRV